MDENEKKIIEETAEQAEEKAKEIVENGEETASDVKETFEKLPDMAEDNEKKENESGKERSADDYIEEESFEDELKEIEKKAGRRERAKTVILTAVITVLAVAILLAASMLIPTPKNSLFAKLIKAYGNTRVVYYEKDPNNTVIDGQTIPSGSNVEIKVETDSVAAATYAKAAKSVVGIKVTQTTGKFWEKETTTVCEGSGVIYTEDGYIITNHHIIEHTLDSNGKKGDEYMIQVFLDPSLLEYFEAKIIGYDSVSDLALIKIEKTGLAPIEIADSDSVEIGQTAVAIGSPGGIAFMNSVTTGIISGVSRNISSETTTAYDLIQTDTTINPGNSGGALLNKEGEMIGICVLKVVASGYENMGFAISSNTVKTVIPQLMEKGKVIRTRLGVEIYTAYNKNVADEYGYPLGCYVNSVVDGSCADKAGIKKDDIITAIEGTQIIDFFQMRKILLSYNPGDKVTITVFRFGDNSFTDLVVTLDEAT
ncbi:MAG: trypsin-like peptidase domain-containing protein [Clostridia bacterium]|nr:trypsin-like peptidase domain-containing protein [Clostridia bacterium]